MSARAAACRHPHRIACWLASLLLPALAAAAPSPAELVDAIRASDYGGVERLLAARADPDALLADGSTPLSWAAEVQDPRLVRLLLEAKARPDAARNVAASPLLLACEHGNAEVLQMLIEAGADPRRTRADGVAPLAVCAGSAPAAVLAALIEKGARIDAVDQKGQTALMWAAAHGRVDNIELLIARGANVNRNTAAGFTPLFFALKSGNPLAPGVVLDAGGDAAHVGPESTTAVQLAMYQKQYAFAARLIEAGASLTQLDRNGHALLHAAALANQPALVKLLLGRGADPRQTTGQPRVAWRYEANFKAGEVTFPPKTALQLATEKKFTEVMQLLSGAGALRAGMQVASARETGPQQNSNDPTSSTSGGVIP